MSPEQHSNAVHGELIQYIMALKKSPKKKLLKRMAYALHKLATSQETAPIERVSLAPPVTYSTNPTARATLQASLRTYFRTTRKNTPDMVPLVRIQEQPTRKSPRLNPGQYAPAMAPVIATEPNS